MSTSGLAYGPGSVDYQKRIDLTDLRQQRTARAVEVMGREGLDAIVATGSAYGRYLASLTGPEFAPALWYVLLTASGHITAFMNAGYITRGPEDSPWVDDWRVARSWLRGIPGAEACTEEAGLFARDIADEVRRLGLAGGRIGVAGFDGYGTRALQEGPLDTVPADEALRTAMAVKTAPELDCFRMVAAITDRMWCAIEHEVTSGMTTSEASAVATRAAYSAGADSANAGFRTGPLVAERATRSTNQILLPGHLMYSNVCGTSYMGYHSCVYRTFTVGREPTEREQGWMRQLQDRLGAVIDALRPGNTTADAAVHFPPASTWGLEDEVEVLTLEIGHGIGLHSYEQPVVNRQWSLAHPQEIVPGMVIAIEGREGARGEAMVRTENMVIVGETGPEVIDRFNYGITPLR